VAVNCSTDAIVPAGFHSYNSTSPFATKIVDGNIDDLNAALYEELLAKIDFSAYNKSIIKGCSQKPVPTRAYVLAAQYLQPYARSIMYGEACSAVPLYKAKNRMN
jgi:hypothetical protein